MPLESSGWEELVRRLRDMGERGERGMSRALKAGGEVIKDEAVRNVPERSGELKASIRVTNAREDVAGAKYVHVKQGNNKAWYGRMVHEGHPTRGGGNVPARPFMRIAWERKKDEALNKIRDEMRRELGL
jgi:HK97 gp10 family phage protein